MRMIAYFLTQKLTLKNTLKTYQNLKNLVSNIFHRTRSGEAQYPTENDLYFEKIITGNEEICLLVCKTDWKSYSHVKETATKLLREKHKAL